MQIILTLNLLTSNFKKYEANGQPKGYWQASPSRLPNIEGSIREIRQPKKGNGQPKGHRLSSPSRLPNVEGRRREIRQPKKAMDSRRVIGCRVHLGCRMLKVQPVRFGSPKKANGQPKVEGTTREIRQPKKAMGSRRVIGRRRIGVIFF